MATGRSTRGRSGRRDAEISKHVADHARSGMSVAAYARKHGIPAWRLYGARRRKGSSTNRFIEVEVCADDGRAPLELLLESGLRISVARDFDASTLRRLLELLAPC